MDEPKKLETGPQIYVVDTNATVVLHGSLFALDHLGVMNVLEDDAFRCLAGSRVLLNRGAGCFGGHPQGSLNVRLRRLPKSTK